MANYDPLSFTTLITTAGVAAASAKISYFETGSSTPKAVYSDAGLTTPITQPVRASSLGIMPVVYLSAGRYKRSVTTSADVTLSAYAADPIDSSAMLITAAALPSDTYPLMRVHLTSDGHIWRRNAANSAWIDEGAVDSLGNAATVTQQLAGTATSAFSTPDSVAALWERGTDIASASTISLPSTGGYEFNITGTTTITAISTAQGGRKVRFTFASGLKITYNVTSMIIPGAVDLTVRAGDIVEFTNEAAQGASGANWRVSDIAFNNSAPLQAPTSLSKSADYTVTDADRGGSIRFASMGADRTLTLPAASGRAGFLFYLSNEDTTDTTPYGVTVDPNSSELIDGVSTRKGHYGTRVAILCDGTGWRTVAGNWRYRSDDTTCTANTNTALSHGLGVRPKNAWVELKCSSTDAGYAAGDIVRTEDTEGGSGSAGYGVYYDSGTLTSVVNLRIGSSVAVAHKTPASGVATITLANWRFRVYAED